MDENSTDNYKPFKIGEILFWEIGLPIILGFTSFLLAKLLPLASIFSIVPVFLVFFYLIPLSVLNFVLSGVYWKKDKRAAKTFLILAISGIIVYGVACGFMIAGLSGI